jgi:hypothetical protein
MSERGRPCRQAARVAGARSLLLLVGATREWHCDCHYNKEQKAFRNAVPYLFRARR